MIALCKLCQTMVVPIEVLPLKPAMLAKIPEEQLEIMKFSAGVTEHCRTFHPEFLQQVQQFAGNFIGHCTLSTVDPTGYGRHMFRAMADADNQQLRAYWEAMPNPPHPDRMNELQSMAHRSMEFAMLEDNRERDERDAARLAALGTLPPPRTIDLNLT